MANVTTAVKKHTVLHTVPRGTRAKMAADIADITADTDSMTNAMIVEKMTRGKGLLGK